MSSLHSTRKQISANALYINVGPIQSTIVDTVLSTVSWVNLVNALSTPGAVILRDMGKTVYVANATGLTHQSTILRKVQLVPSGPLGSYGTGAAAAGNAAPGGPQEYYTGYIRLGGQTYGGGDGFATAVARIQ
jgi:hypothetical protein